MELHDLLAKNIPLRNAHEGRRCFVIGNGPSNTSLDLTYLQNEICIAVSSFHRNHLARLVKPSYWFLADPDFWEMPEKHLFPALQQVHNLGIPTRLFVPSGGISCLTAVNTGPFIDTHFFHYDHAVGIEKAIDFTGGIPPYGQNVVIVALMFSFFLGCNPIYLIGCDHDFMALTREGYEGHQIRHFYAEEKPPEPSKRLPWDVWENCMKIMDFQYSQLNMYASNWCFEVFNATPGGCLKHFPRIEFESLFPLKTATTVAALVTTKELFDLAQAAVGLIESGDDRSALVLLDEAIRHNVNRNEKVEGLYYLKAACLAKLGRYHEALLFARQDRSEERRV